MARIEQHDKSASSHLRVAASRLKCGVALCALALAAVGPAVTSAHAQSTLPGFEQLVAEDPDARMLLEANELVYDFDRNIVSAEGDVEIHYRGHVIESDRVIYDQNTRRVFARGNVRLQQPDGTVTYAETVELTDDFREGFVEQLTVVTTEDARFAAISAERVEDNLTIFTQGVYTACEPCKEDPSRAPVWQVKAARIIHDQQEKVIHYENARFELLGVPVAYMPYFRHPDPTVKRQSGFLPPTISFNSDLGQGLKVPYYFALAPNYDLTVASTGFTRQGVLGEFQWRHRLTRGVYAITGAGIKQLDPDAFTPGSEDDRDLRGTVRALGEFRINDFWRWGFDGRVSSDTTFERRYKLASSSDRYYTNRVYLTGQSARNWFDGRVVDYRSLTRKSDNAVLPTVHPVVDHNYIFGQPVLGGQVSVDTNLLSLSREEADFANLNPRLPGDARCGRESVIVALATDDPDRLTQECELIGAPGTYSRLVARATWEASFVNRLGQIFKPFAWLRGDLYALDLDDPYLQQTGGAPAVGQFVSTESQTLGRVMPAVGLEHRWPILIDAGWSQHVVEPVAQVIARTDETLVDDLPNEDAQSLFFDYSTLFAYDKFSGYDRVEGGTRANLGVRYNVQAINGMTAGAVVGQSFHLAGQNPFPVGSGLERTRSDYVAAAFFSPTSNLELSGRLRIDERDQSIRRQDLEAAAGFGVISASARYSEIGQDPDLGIDYERRELLGRATVNLTDNWRVFGSGRVELSGPNSSGAQWISNSVGLGYADECISLAIAYERRYVRDGDLEPDQRITFRFNIRTITEGQVQTDLGSRN